MTAGVAILCLVFILVCVGFREWQRTLSETNVCQKGTGVPNLSIAIDTQDLRSPIFNGEFLLSLGNMFDNVPVLEIHQSELKRDGTRASSTFRQALGWFPEHNRITSIVNNGIGFISHTTSHYMFPFDSAKFDDIFSTTPAMNFESIAFTNRVPGFYMPCNKLMVVKQKDGLRVVFVLNRNPLIRDAAVLLLSIAAAFAILITLFMENGPLPHALSSYFFGVWTIRVLFGLTPEGFPTIFDLCIISLVLFTIVLLILRDLGLRQALIPIARGGRNVVRKLEARELLETDITLGAKAPPVHLCPTPPPVFS